MAIIEFGNTWWGSAWLKALAGIDYSNRLPRGKRYARNGSVRDIIIEENRVTAKVQGRTPRPYHISLTVPAFTKKQITLLEKRIRENLYYISRLEGMTLPRELAEECENQHIPLFPGSWKELKMQCSCPDWAVPCKHLAAVVYIIANEIDKNPFILFNLHRMNLVKIFQLETRKEEIRKISNMTAQVSYNREKLQVDLTAIPSLTAPTLRLLTEKPLFYPRGDFKEIMTQVYKKTARSTLRFIKESELEEEGKAFFPRVKLKLTKKKLPFHGLLESQEKLFTFSPDNMEEVIRVLRGQTAEEDGSLTSFLVTLYNYTLMLLQQGAFIPEILALEKEGFIIRWIPSLFNKEVKTIFDRLTDCLPEEIVTYGSKPLEKREQVLFLISLLITGHLNLFEACKDPYGDKIKALFFKGEVYIPGIFGTQENPQTINLWLSRFFIRPRVVHPVIKIEEMDGEKFLINLLVRKNEEILQLTEFLSQDDKERFPLLRDLSLLATYLPVINKILEKEKEIPLSSEELASLWFDSLEVLKTLGISILLPRSLKEIFFPRLSLSFKAADKEANITNYLSLKSIMNFQWSIALGDIHITPDEFRKLIQSTEGIVKYKNHYIFLEPEMLQKIEKQMTKDPALTPLDMLRIHLTGEHAGAPVEKDPALEKVLQKFFLPEETPLPGNLQAVLRPYQEAGYRWLYHNTRIGLGSLIADDMGLGKTLQVITLLARWKEEGLLKKKKALVIAPATLLTNWEREIKKFAPGLEVKIYHGPGRELDLSRDILLTTYSLVRQDKEKLQKIKWRGIILDEAQNIKNPGTDQTKSVKSLKGEVMIAMTGTPVENRLMDYWSILDFTMKKLLGTRNHFKEEFALPIEKFRDSGKLNLFRKLTAPFILRRLKTDKSIIRDLPEKVELQRYPVLTPAQAALYQQQVDSMDELLKNQTGINRKGAILKLIVALKQICNHPSNFMKTEKASTKDSGKTLMLQDILSRCGEEKTLIFTQFREMGTILEKLISREQNSPALFLHGGLPRTRRDEIVDSFQNDPGFKVLILSLKAGGTGLNLTAATNVIHYDLWWNPAVEAQATDRAFRIGQTRQVMVHRFVTKNTFEEKIDEMLHSKQDLADLTVKTGENWITEMKDKDLKKLLALERD